MISVFVDRTANMAAIDVQPGRPITSTAEVGASLLANYDDAGALVSVEILSLRAVQLPEVVAELHRLLGDLGELSEGTGFAGSPFGFSSLAITPRRLNVVDILIQQINRAVVEDGNAQRANVLV
jgi:hypothetical protein